MKNKTFRVFNKNMIPAMTFRSEICTEKTSSAAMLDPSADSLSAYTHGVSARSI